MSITNKEFIESTDNRQSSYMTAKTCPWEITERSVELGNSFITIM